MVFTTDKQTQDDLNILGREGIHTLFQRCSTRGGAALLEEMFLYPLSDAAAINKRSGMISYFSAAGWQFPYNTSLFDPVETYLANTDERSKLTERTNTMSDRLGRLVGNDIETQQLHQGLEALVQLLKDVRAFVNEQAAGGYEEEAAAIRNLLSHTALEPVFTRKVEPGFDVLLRFRHRDIMQELLRRIYQLDVYIAVGVVARERNFCFATALPQEQGTLELEGVYHPQVKNAVPNRVVMDAGSNLVFLTGANMAGKSTFMKSVCVAVYMAHMGFPVAAGAMSFSVLDGIYTTINLPDNLGMGASHFYAEVLRVKKMALELQQGKRLLIVFDELFRGTNVKDACDATVAIVAGFAAKQHSRFIISTHIMEAGVTLRERCASVQFLYMPTGMQDNKPVYTYTATAGISDDRHGMVIIRNEGILETLRNGKKKQHEIHNR
jgi:DNA mismatch repair ATPase MutS